MARKQIIKKVGVEKDAKQRVRKAMKEYNELKSDEKTILDILAMRAIISI